MQLKYYVPFKAQIGQQADLALKEKLLNIEGVAIDTSVNSNKWQVPEEDLDFFVSSLQGAQLRIDHAESAMAVIGKVPEAKRAGQQALFRAEIGDQAIIEKVLRGYLTHVSVQVDSDDVECSKCRKPSRKEGMLIHLCPSAWEIVHKPKVRELSIVASPAYKNTEFKPLGFASAMNESQKNVGAEFEALGYPTDEALKRWSDTRANAAKGMPEADPQILECWEKARIELRKGFTKRLLVCRLNLARLRSSENDEDVGSRRESQEPEFQQHTKEVKPLSENAQAKASPHTAQGIVNVAPGEGPAKQVTYDEFQNQLKTLSDQLMKAEGAEVEALGKKVAEIESEIAKHATKKALTQKINELSKKLSESASDAQEDAKKGKKGENGDAEDLPGPKGPKAPDQAETAESAAHKPTGKGLISTEEMDQEASGPSAPWFKDMLKASAKLGAGGHATFSG